MCLKTNDKVKTILESKGLNIVPYSNDTDRNEKLKQVSFEQGKLTSTS